MDPEGEGAEKSPRLRGSRLRRVAPGLTRRELLRESAVTTGLAAVLGGVAWLASSEEPIRRAREPILTLKDFRVPADPSWPQLVIVYGERVEAMTRAAVDGLGGLSRFVRRGDKVLLKPNVGWDRQPEQAANTGPELVAAVVRLCLEAGAAEVWVTDCSLNDPRRCFSRSGIEAAVRPLGARVLIPLADDYRLTDLGGEVLKVWPVARYYYEVDKVINLPIVKHHSLSGGTLAMKNWYGILGGQRSRLHQDIHPSIVDLAAAMRPTLTIMDATRVLKRNGPTGGNLDDVMQGNTLLAGVDEVALDARGLEFLDLSPEQVPALALAVSRGLGTSSWRTLNWIEKRV